MQIVVLWHKTLCGSQFVLWHKTLRDKVVLWHKTHQKCKLLSYAIRHCVGVKLSYTIRHCVTKLSYAIRHCVGVKLSYAIRHCVGVKLSYAIRLIKIQIAVLWHKTIHSCVSELFLCISVLLDCSGARPQLDLYFD